jgi:hypothetical protein
MVTLADTQRHTIDTRFDLLLFCGKTKLALEIFTPPANKNKKKTGAPPMPKEIRRPKTDKGWEVVDGTNVVVDKLHGRKLLDNAEHAV